MRIPLSTAAALSLSACGPAAPAPPPSPELGRQVFLAHCALCHGERGDGQGPRHAYLVPRPPDFGRIRARLSAAHVMDTVRRGVPGTSMPAWPGLTSEELAAVAAHVVALSGDRP